LNPLRWIFWSNFYYVEIVVSLNIPFESGAIQKVHILWFVYQKLLKFVNFKKKLYPLAHINKVYFVVVNKSQTSMHFSYVFSGTCVSSKILLFLFPLGLQFIYLFINRCLMPTTIFAQTWSIILNYSTLIPFSIFLVQARCITN
jgi:hypothetical protein